MAIQSTLLTHLINSLNSRGTSCWDQAYLSPEHTCLTQKLSCGIFWNIAKMNWKNNFQGRISLMISSPVNITQALQWFLPESGGDCVVKHIKPICPETFFFSFCIWWLGCKVKMFWVLGPWNCLVITVLFGNGVGGIQDVKQTVTSLTCSWS